MKNSIVCFRFFIALIGSSFLITAFTQKEYKEANACITTNWQEMTNGIRKKEVSAAYDGTVWATDINNRVYKLDKMNGNQWVGVNAILSKIVVGSMNNIWGLNATNQIFKWNGTAFQTINNFNLTQIAAGKDGTVCGINSSGIYRYDGSGLANTDFQTMQKPYPNAVVNQICLLDANNIIVLTSNYGI